MSLPGSPSSPPHPARPPAAGRRMALAGAIALPAALLIVLAVLSSDGGGLGRLLAVIAAEQRALAQELQRVLIGMRDGSGTAWVLIVGSFAYGLLHAAGPGHGKVVLTTYLATQPAVLGRAVGLATAAALLQGLVAIALVLVLVAVGGLATAAMHAAALWVERASYALVIVLGLFLAGRAIGSAARSHQGAHAHAHGEGCAHHAPPPPGALRDAVGVVLSIGLRPCSGALVVLLAAHLMGLTAVGVAAVLAMSAGTALAVGTLALLTAAARQWAASLAETTWGARPRRALRLAGAAVGLAGGALIALAGGLLMAGTFQPLHPLAPGGPLG